MVEPGTTRPGGRTARVRASVLTTAGDVLVEHGLLGLELADVARRAGIGKTTVYRRWGSVPVLIADLVAEMTETSRPRAATGTLVGDLAALAALVTATLADPRQGRLFIALITAAAGDERTSAALRDFYDNRVAEWEPCVREAIERGEVPADTDTAAVIRAVSAPLYHRLLTRGETPDAEDARVAAEAVTAAARAGAYTPRTDAL